MMEELSLTLANRLLGALPLRLLTTCWIPQLMSTGSRAPMSYTVTIRHWTASRVSVAVSLATVGLTGLRNAFAQSSKTPSHSLRPTQRPSGRCTVTSRRPFCRHGRRQPRGRPWSPWAPEGVPMGPKGIPRAPWASNGSLGLFNYSYAFEECVSIF